METTVPLAKGGRSAAGGGFCQVNFLDIEKNQEYADTVYKVLEKCYQEENLQEKNLYTNVVLTNSKNIKKLNKKYRNIDKETDVLSFPMFEKIPKKSKTPDILGDIVISIEQVEKQSIEYAHTFTRELSYMAVHSFYHLLGYDHMNDADKAKMRAKEEAVLCNV